VTERDERPPEEETVLSKIAKNPVVNLLIGVGGIIIGLAFAAGFYFLVEQKEIKPRYAVSEPETLAEATADAPGLTLLWEGEEIENVHTIDVVIWNAGRQFLDKNAISATDPIRITYPPGVKILYRKFVRTSRDSLEFTATDLAGAGTRAIQVEIVGDEALERKDGGLLKILFSGPSTKEFGVTGRIKGSREGFTKADWDRISSGPDWVFLVVGINGALFVGTLVAFSIHELWRIYKSGLVRVRTWLLMLVLVLFLLVMVWTLRNTNVVRLIFGLPWLP
jgi:hypothetical protein